MLSLSIEIMVLCDNLTSSGQTVVNIKHYTINDFPWGEYKDWSTNGTWYSIVFYCFVYKHCNNRFCYRFCHFQNLFWNTIFASGFVDINFIYLFFYEWSINRFKLSYVLKWPLHLDVPDLKHRCLLQCL